MSNKYVPDGFFNDRLLTALRRKAAESRSHHLCQVRENITDILRLATILQKDFYDTSSIDELVQALFFNSSITSIGIGSVGWHHIAPPDLAKLLAGFQQIGPNITQLSFFGSEMPSQLLSTYLWCFRNLRKISLHYKRNETARNTFASWNQSDWGVLSNALRQHPALEHFSLGYEDCRADILSNDEAALALITAPNLVEYRQTGSKTFMGRPLGPKLSVSVLVELIRSSTLRVLEYGTLGFARQHSGTHNWTGLQEALHSSNLRELSLEDNGLNDEEIRMIADGVRENAKLEILNLRSNNPTYRGGVQALVSMVGANQGLKRLDLFQCLIPNDGLAAFASVLQGNSCLEYVNLAGNQSDGAAPLVLSAFANTLKSNEMLKILLLDWNHQTCRDPTSASYHNVQEINFYLDLNKTGRNSDNSREQCVEALVENRAGRLDVLFYFVRANPYICWT